MFTSIKKDLTKKNSVQIDEEENFVDEEPEEEEEDAEEDLMLMHSQINPNSAPKEGENHRVLSEKEARRKLHHMRMLYFFLLVKNQFLKFAIFLNKVGIETFKI